MSVNKVILIGNVGKDPDIRYLDNNVCVANFPLATTDRAYTTRAGVQICLLYTSDAADEL